MKRSEPFRLPPLIKSVDVRCTPERAFKLFTAEIHVWWPLVTHSLAQDNAAAVVMEPRVGGRLFERDKQGNESDWGHVLVWDPPHRVRFTWRVGRAANSQQEVEVVFEATAQGTRVTLTHSGWETPETRTNYDRGWDFVLGCYVQSPAAATPAVNTSDS